MKLLCCSDTHSRPLPQLDETEATAWLHAGDVYNDGYNNKTPKAQLTPDFPTWFGQRKIPVFAVKGNHDCFMSMSFFDLAQNAGGRCLEIEPGTLLLGLGWSGGMFCDLPRESDMAQVCAEAKREWILKSRIGDKTILLTHYPPWIPSLYNYDKNPEVGCSTVSGNWLMKLSPWL